MALVAAALMVASLFALPSHAFQGIQFRSHTRHRATVTSSASAALSPVIICPAQFGTEDDYAGLKAALEAAGHPKVVVTPLSRLAWLRILPSAFTKAYWDSSLQITPALDFYLSAIDEAVAEVRSSCGEETPITVVGHSIGGWVARGYLAERPNVLAKVNVIATLGSPNRSPPVGSLWASADQTRGLLRSVNEKWVALGDTRPPKTVCVIGRGTLAEFKPFSVWNEDTRRSPLLEGFLALVSYLALSGEGIGAFGDGLIPTSAAVVDLGTEDASEVTIIELEDCNHADFVPTPGLSLKLPETYQWYGSSQQLLKWLPELRASEKASQMISVSEVIV